MPRLDQPPPAQRRMISRRGMMRISRWTTSLSATSSSQYSGHRGADEMTSPIGRSDDDQMAPGDDRPAEERDVLEGRTIPADDMSADDPVVLDDDQIVLGSNQAVPDDDRAGLGRDQLVPDDDQIRLGSEQTVPDHDRAAAGPAT